MSEDPPKSLDIEVTEMIEFVEKSIVYHELTSWQKLSIENWLQLKREGVI